MSVIAGPAVSVGATTSPEAVLEPSRETISATTQSGGVAAGDLPGSGTQQDPYRISNVSALQAMEDDLGASYELVTDIDASTTARWNDGSGFDPVGQSLRNRFTGSFDGNDHTITGLTIDRPDEDDVGLFGRTGDETAFTNVTLTNVTVTGNIGVGGLVGFNSGTVQNATVSGSLSGSNRVGGLLGASTGTVTNTAASGSVNGSRSVGGLIGNNRNNPNPGQTDGTVTGARASVNVTGDDAVGGLVGLNSANRFGDAATITNATASGDASGRLRTSPTYVGGLVGFNQGTVTAVSASGNATGSTAGGLVGQNSGTIRIAKASGDVSSGFVAGGLVGDNGEGTIRDTLAVGSVTGEFDAGGLLGRDVGTEGTVERSYFDTRATGQRTSAGNATGLPTAEMQGEAARENMVGFEFGGSWQTAARDYPELVALSDTRNRENGSSDRTHPNPSLSVVSQPSGTVGADATFDVTYRVTNTGDTAGAFTLTVSQTSANVSVERFTGDVRDSTLDESPPSTSTTGVGLGQSVPVTVTYRTTQNATGAGDVTLEATGALSGATDTARTAVTIGESQGEGDTPQPSQVEVIEGTPAADTDGDGFLDDINGNDEIDRGDAQALFAALGRAVLADNADVLDRNGNGAVDRGDVQAVFQAATS